MNKIKMVLIATAILAGVGGAFATRTCVQCENAQQYVLEGSNYTPVAGVFEIDWYCYWTAGVCTWYKPDPLGNPNLFAPCREGTYFRIDVE